MSVHFSNDSERAAIRSACGDVEPDLVAAARSGPRRSDLPKQAAERGTRDPTHEMPCMRGLGRMDAEASRVTLVARERRGAKIRAQGAAIRIFR